MRPSSRPGVRGILPRIAELDAFMTPSRQRRIIEVHPEISFHQLAGGKAMRHPRSEKAGLDERRRILQRALGTRIDLEQLRAVPHPRTQVAKQVEDETNPPTTTSSSRKSPSLVAT